ncbi:MAG: chitobiase/beta-hexosaminidase C-terminal domain-containing protein [Eubacterium sp.]
MKRKYVYTSLIIILTMILIVSGCGKSEKTTISLVSGEYMGEQEVVLTSKGDGEIYYTLDGSDPKENGLKYNPDKPLKINFDATLKAYTKNGNTDGPVEEVTYKIKPIKVQELKPGERAFLGVITGKYQNGQDVITINTDRTVEWKDKSGSGKSTFIVAVPEGTDGYKGTLVYTNSEGKEGKYEIDCLPQGDNAIFINGVSYAYLE